MTDRRVAVFRGGPSAEHDVSLESGRQVLQALDGQGLDVVIRPDGAWVIGGDEQPSIGAAIDRVRAETEVAFIALHGPFGEDGTIQGLLEVIGVPYTGSGVAASGLAMDKVRTKAIYRDAGLPTAPAVAIEPTSFEENKKTLLDDIESKVGLPCVVKPACDGSSFGVSLPAHRVGLEAAIETMTRAGRVVLAEKRISGTELTCAVLEYDDGPRPMPVTEIAPADKYAFFDYEAKYTPGASQEITPARIPDALRDELQRLAVAAHKALGCRDMSRTDFIADDERPWLLETNTIPGLTGNSLLPQAAAAAGLSFPRLIQHLVACARRRA